MRRKNEKIVYSGAELIEVFQELDLLVVSLHKMGSYYGEDENWNKREYEKETTRFIDECRVTGRLAKIRRILEEKVDDTLGDDNMDDFEREMEHLKYWEKPGDNITIL
jgi:hypothetical protein